MFFFCELTNRAITCRFPWADQYQQIPAVSESTNSGQRGKMYTLAASHFVPRPFIQRFRDNMSVWSPSCERVEQVLKEKSVQEMVPIIKLQSTRQHSKLTILSKNIVDGICTLGSSRCIGKPARRFGRNDRSIVGLIAIPMVAIVASGSANNSYKQHQLMEKSS